MWCEMKLPECSIAWYIKDCTERKESNQFDITDVAQYAIDLACAI